MDFSAIGKRLGQFVVDNSPAILTALGSVGVVSTAVAAVRATPYALRDIWDAESERIAPLTAVEKVRLTWTYFIPTAAIGATSILCIIGANHIHVKRHAAIISAYSLTETAYREYRDKVEETFGAKKSEEIRDKISEDHVKATPVQQSSIIPTGNGRTLFFDDLTGRYFYSDMESVRKAVNDLNASLFNNTYASQNDFYRLVGLPIVAYGEEVGWRTDHMLEVSYSTMFAENSEPCSVINYDVAPIRGYYKGH